MKSMLRITGLFMVAVVACNASLSAQKEMKTVPDSSALRPERGMYRHWGPPMKEGDTLYMKRMHDNFRYGHFHNFNPGMGPEHLYGMRRGGGYGMRGPGQIPAERFGMRSLAPLYMRVEALPDLTDKQRADLEAIRKKQTDDMRKVMDDFTGKMQSLREDNRKKIKSLLTDEQKKKIESDEDNPGKAHHMQH